MTVSLHEASHGVAAVLVGLPPLSISINPNATTAGRMNHGRAAFEALERAGDDDRDLLKRLAVISMAGPLGEQWLDEDPYWSPFRGGIDWAGSGRLDMDRVELLASLHGGETFSLVRTWFAVTVGTIHGSVRNGTIAKVAAALEGEGVLTGGEVERIVGTRGMKASRLPRKEITVAGRTVLARPVQLFERRGG